MTAVQPSIQPGNTTWLLIAHACEPRHWDDLAYVQMKLREAGHPPGKIHFFADPPFPASDTSNLLGAPIPGVPVSDVCVVIVSGHGSARGLGPITPTQLTQVARAHGTSLGVLVLGQCYAGIFNPIDCKTEPPLVCMGATNLDVSLSIPCKVEVNGQVVSWTANMFVARISEWFAKPVDTDGDGKLTLADAYKYAGATSAESLAHTKGRDFYLATKLAADLKERLECPVDLPHENLEREMLERDLSSTLGAINSSQTPWLINAHLATAVEVAVPTASTTPSQP